MMLKRVLKSTYLLLAIAGVVLVGCLDEIDFDVPAENQESLVIQGRLVKGDPHMISVEVKRLFDFTGGSSFIRVAYVRITNDLGQSIDLTNAALGIYEASIPVNDPNFEIRTGGSYKATVETLDDRKYESTFEILHPVSRVDDVTARIVQREVPVGIGTEIRDRVQFLLNTPLTVTGEEEKARINWQVTRTYKLTEMQTQQGVAPRTCYITDNVNVEEVKPFDGNILDIDYLADYELYESNITFHYRQGLYLNILQQSLSKGAFEYWDQIDRLLERNGNMFESPVGEIVSNFENVVDRNEDIFGYFYATEIDTLNVYVDSTFVGSVSQYCPPPLPPPAGGGCAVELCCDCLFAPNSTTTKPDYWQ